MLGVKSKEELANYEYKEFQKRLDELRAIKKAITEAIATAVQIAVEAALTVMTAGVAGGALLASIGAAVAGMLMREAFLGSDYDMLSKENARQLAAAVAGFGFGSVSKSLASGIVNPQMLKELSTIRVFMEEVTGDAFKQLNVQILTAGMDGKMPTVESISASAVSIVIGSAGSGAGAAIKKSIGGNAADITQLRVGIIASISKNVISGTGEEAGEYIKTGTANMTGPELAARFGKRTGEAASRGVVDGVSGFMADKAKKSKEGKAAGDTKMDNQSEADNVPTRKTQDKNHDLKVTRNGIVFICSWPCEFLASRYGRVLKEKPDLKMQLEDIKKLPPEQGLDEAVKLEATLKNHLSLILEAKRPELSLNPETGLPDKKSISEAETIIQAEKAGLVKNARRPNLQAREINHDFIADSGYVEVKTAVLPSIRPLKTQAEDIAPKINYYGSNVVQIIDLKNLSKTEKDDYKAHLKAAGANLGKVNFLND